MLHHATVRSDPQRIGAAMFAGAVLCAALPGCNIVGPAFYLVHGPEKTPALYDLPADRATVVFVDDRSSALPSRSIRQRIARAAEKALLDGGAVPKAEVISSDAIAPIAAAERFNKPKSIADVGTAVGAQIVIYATVDSFGLSPDGQQFGPGARLRVKVVESESKARLWPEAPDEWYTLVTSTPVRTIEVPRSQADRALAEQELADRVGRDLGHIFIKHQANPGSERIGKSS